MLVQTAERTCRRFTLQYPMFSHPKFMLPTTVHRRFHISYSRHFLFTLSARLYWHFVVCRDPGLMEVVGDAGLPNNNDLWSCYLRSISMLAVSVTIIRKQSFGSNLITPCLEPPSIIKRWRPCASRPDIKDLLQGGTGFESNSW